MDITEQNLTVTEKQLKAIPVILEAKSIAEGVKKARISRTTFYEWLKDSKFKAEFTRQRKEVVELALHELKASASEAVKVLRELLKSESEAIRLRASITILEHVSKFKELEEIEERLTELERNVNNGKY